MNIQYNQLITLCFLLLIIFSHHKRRKQGISFLPPQFRSRYFLIRKIYYYGLPVVLMIMVMLRIKFTDQFMLVYGVIEFFYNYYGFSHVIRIPNFPQILLLLIFMAWISATGLIILSFMKLMF